MTFLEHESKIYCQIHPQVSINLFYLKKSKYSKALTDFFLFKSDQANAIETLWGLWHVIPYGCSCFLKTQEVRLVKISKKFSVPNSGSKATPTPPSPYCISILLCPLSYWAITSKWVWYRPHSWQLQGPFWTFSWGQSHLSCMPMTAIPCTGTVLQNRMKNHSQHPSSKAPSTK